ncbi:Hypothetical protein BHY_1009 (plasmid) [Borrelia nietonii YOR]|uniref:Lipoprotein n=2 Tax=Borrelia TaxID=138 RepID=W5SAK0_9SPIR|nr:Hypothetical protein BHY_1009 [Borrelia nietonii YOR]
MLMKKICMVMFILNVLVLVLGCGPKDRKAKEKMPLGEDKLRTLAGEDKPGTPAGEDKPGTPAEEDKPGTPAEEDKPGTPAGEDKPGTPEEAYMALVESFNKFKESLSYKPEGFDESKFDNIFSIVWADIPRAQYRQVHISLKRDVESLDNLKAIVMNLTTKTDNSEVNLRTPAELLAVLGIIGIDLGFIESNVNLIKSKDVQDVEGLGELEDMLDDVLIQRETMVGLLQNTIRQAAALSDKEQIKEALKSITDSRKDYTMQMKKCVDNPICVVGRNLTNLRYKIQDKVNALIK